MVRRLLECLESRTLMAADALGVVSAAAAGGVAQEVDVVHVGGEVTGRMGAYVVSGVGSGASIQLDAWRWSEGAAAPLHLQSAPPLAGRDLALEVLTTTDPSEATRRTFLAGRIASDGNLWLASYELTVGGSFVELSSRGYGQNAQVTVVDHDIAHSPAADNSAAAQVVTPVMVRNAEDRMELRIVSWRVNLATGLVDGLADSGPLSTSSIPADGGQVAIRLSEPGLYDVTYTNTHGNLVTHYVGVTANGSVLPIGDGASGKDFLGDPTSHHVDQIVSARLNGDAFVALSLSDGDREMTVWERRSESCITLICDQEPYQLGTSQNDQRPQAPGVAIPLPELTHAYGTSPSNNAWFGSSVASGDFNGDGIQDVAIGAPGQRVDGHDSAGAVTILYGSPEGIYNDLKNTTFTQGTAGVQGAPDAGDLFGFALAAGDFNGDGRDDLAVGVPGESIEPENLIQAGVVQVFMGSAQGLQLQGNVLLRQGENGVAGITETGDQFGYALTTGDYNGDGRADLAVGIPYEDHNATGAVDAGAVHILYGSAAGLRTDNDISWHQDLVGILETAETNDWFGYSLASGDLDNDGRDDLAVGVPGEQAFGMAAAGGVHIFMGAGSGLSTQDQFVTQDGILAGANGTLMADISDATEEGDRFGESLAMADFDGDGLADLAIGVPYEDFQFAGVAINQAGRLHVLRGSVDGITAVGEKVLDQASTGIASDPEIGGRFAQSLAVGEIHGDGFADLLVGSPFQDSRPTGNVIYANSGVAYLIPGTANGLSAATSRQFRQGTNSLGNQHSPGDQFGFALALADIDHDGFDDALIGVPQEEMSKLGSDYTNAGALHVIYSDSNAGGLSTADVLWGQGKTKHIRAQLASSTWEQQYGVGNGTLYADFPAGDILPEHAASVTKTMTLLLAAEALQLPNSPVSLSDVVTISEKAGTTGGSKMEGKQDGNLVYIEPGDQLTLETLLYGMIIPSGNRASVAIAEHIAVHVYGANPNNLDEPFDVFVDRMNARAAAIGLHDTRYGHPAGGSVTTPQDLITFYREAWKNSLFRRFDSATAAHPDNPATTLNLDPPKEFVLKRTNSYVGMDGYKGGHGKVGDVYDEDGQIISAPICDQCHVGQATRGGESLIVGIQQSNDGLSNAKEMYDYGFGLLFTPDRRGVWTQSPSSNGGITTGQPPMGDLQSLALDHLTDSWVVTAAIDASNHLQLRTWSVNASSGSVVPSGGVIVTRDNLAPSSLESEAQRLAIASLPTPGKVLGDFVTAQVVQGRLRLELWRLGAEYAPPADPADLNFDGSVDAADAAILFGSWGETGLADLNGDGIVDAADAGELFAQWTGDPLPGPPTASHAPRNTPLLTPSALDVVFAQPLSTAVAASRIPSTKSSRDARTALFGSHRSESEL